MNSRTPFGPSSAGPFVPSSRAAGVSRDASRFEGRPGPSVRGIAAQSAPLSRRYHSVRTDFKLMHYPPPACDVFARELEDAPVLRFKESLHRFDPARRSVQADGGTDAARAHDDRRLSAPATKSRGLEPTYT
ncbi:MAG: hypothetical protein ACT4QA_22370, partial [Panacagrimonas sp.]